MWLPQLFDHFYDLHQYQECQFPSCSKARLTPCLAATQQTCYEITDRFRLGQRQSLSCYFASVSQSPLVVVVDQIQGYSRPCKIEFQALLIKTVLCSSFLAFDLVLKTLHSTRFTRTSHSRTGFCRQKSSSDCDQSFKS